MNQIPPGWYTDPSNPNGLRYWDGNAWTSQTQQGSSQGAVAAPPAPPAAPAGAAAAPMVAQGGRGVAQYPQVDYDFQYEEEPGRLTLLNWLLVYPHLLVLSVLNWAVFACGFYAWFAVLFTGRYPRGAFNFIANVFRWQARVNGYHFGLTAQYPPFSLDEEPQYPARFHMAYPESGIARWRPLLQPLIIVPRLYFVAWVIALRVLVRWIIAWWSVLLTGRYPRASYEAAIRVTRWQMRTVAYWFFMVDEYPPTYGQT